MVQRAPEYSPKRRVLESQKWVILKVGVVVMGDLFVGWGSFAGLASILLDLLLLGFWSPGYSEFL